MWAQSLNLLLQGWLACVDWFNRFVLAIPGFFSTWTVIFIMYTIVRLVLIPFMGKSMQDIVNIDREKEMNGIRIDNDK